MGNSSVVPDSAISASETHVNYSPAGARLGSLAGWYTNDKPRSRDWVQVDLGQKKHVTKVATQVYVLVYCGILIVRGGSLFVIFVGYTVIYEYSSPRTISKVIKCLAL